MPLILIVDDEQENLKSLRRALSDENPSWEIITASGEFEAEKLLTEQLANHNPVDVVITDLVMDTEASGMKIVQRARKIDPLVMAILITAKERSLDRYGAFELGAFDVVEKNIRGTSAAREINLKTRAALQYREWSKKIAFMKRYFDPRVFDAIDRDPSLLAIDRKTVTIVFWDIRGFSRLCEVLKAHPTLISGFLAEYCELGAQVIFDHSGVLDKFIGDGVMALFGVLNHKGDEGKADATAAVNAAIDFRAKFDPLLEKWTKQWNLYVADKIEIGLGCGIHTGEAIVGNVGTDFRDQFTALGPQVNLASRIEAKSKSAQILLSQTTSSRVEDTIKISPAGEIDDIKNIPGKFSLFEVLD